MSLESLKDCSGGVMRVLNSFERCSVAASFTWFLLEICLQLLYLWKKAESFMPWVCSSLCTTPLLPLQLQLASRAPQSFTSAGMSDVGGYGGGSLPVNGLTAHQSQVGASIFSRNTAVAVGAAAVWCRTKKEKLSYSWKTDDSPLALLLNIGRA